MAGSPTALSKLGIGAADPVDIAMNFGSFDIGVTRELGNFNGTRGTFFLDGNRMPEIRQTVTPRFSSEPTAAELGPLLEWIMGGTPTGTTTKTYPWSDTPAPRFVHYKPKVGEEWFLANVAVDNGTLTANVGGALAADLDLVGLTYDDSRTNLPALTYDQTLQPFILAQLVLTVDGIAARPDGLTVAIAGGIDRERYFNSLTLTSLLRVNANFAVSFRVPSGDNIGLWKKGIPAAGIVASAVFTNASTGAVLTISFPALRFPAQAPMFAPGSEGFVSVTGTLTRVGSGSPITISLNPGA